MARKKKRRQQSRKRPNHSIHDKQVSIEQFMAERKDAGELSEDEAHELAWDMHPDLNRKRLQDELPDEMIDAGGNAWSPRMHINVHAIIERQLANNDPDGIADVAIQFEREKRLDFHDIQRLYAEFIEAKS